MKFKKIITCLMLVALSFTGVVFGCKDKYKNFSISLEETEIVLSIDENSDTPNSMEVAVKINNAPNNNCKKISYSVSQPNIVEIESLGVSDNIARFNVKANNNITAMDPSCTITFKSFEGNKSCSLKVKVEIPLIDFTINEEEKIVVVANNKFHYINTKNTFNFNPVNSTENDVVYSLVDESLKSKYDIDLTQSGGIKIGKYISEDNVALNEVKLKAQVFKGDGTIKENIVVINVVKNIETNDIAFSFNDEEIDLSRGIVLASNLENQNKGKLSIKLNETSGLDYDKIKIDFANFRLKNAIIDEDINESSSNRKVFNILANNSGLDEISLCIKYKDFENDGRIFYIPVSVLEYPIMLSVNGNNFSSVNIFDNYEGTFGQEFKINVEKISAFDTTFKVIISQEDFDKLIVRYKNENLNYETLKNFKFNSGDSIFVKAKSKNWTEENGSAQIQFVSNILANEEDAKIEDGNLARTISLNLSTGINSLEFSSDKDILLETGKNAKIEYSINDIDFSDLFKNVTLEIEKGKELLTSNIFSSTEDDKNAFIIESKGQEGEIICYLKAENGVRSNSKRILIYNYDEAFETNAMLQLDSPYIKKITSTDNEGNLQTKYFIGVKNGANSATIGVENPKKATIYSAKIESNNNAILVNTLNEKELLFNIFAKENVQGSTRINITIQTYNENSVVNTDPYKTTNISFELNTYSPIISASLVTDEINLIDGDGLDYDSTQNKKLNRLKIADVLSITKDGNNEDITVEYIFPKDLIFGEKGVGDYKLIRGVNDNGEFDFTKDEIVFYAGKNHNFYDNKLSLNVVIKISDLAGSDEYYMLPLKVNLQKQIQVDGITILNEFGFVYIDNVSQINQIKAKAFSNSGLEVTNGDIVYKYNESEMSINEQGVIVPKTSGVFKVTLCAKSSRYSASEDYNTKEEIVVVVADGSENYPYILKNNTTFVENKFYTLSQSVEVSSQINVKIGGIDGKFAYAKYSTLVGKDVNYSIVYTGRESIFGEELNSQLKNLNFAIKENTFNLNEDFGFIAKENKSLVKNVTLNFETLYLYSNNSINIGLFFAINSGEILEPIVSGNVVINGNLSTFGGLIALNNAVVKSNYSFLDNKNHNKIFLTINVNSENLDAVVGGLVAINGSEGEISNIYANIDIKANSKTLGGIVGEINSSNKNFENIYFTGSLISTNDNSIVGGIASTVNNPNNFSLNIVEFVYNGQNVALKGNTVGGLFAKTNGGKIEFSYVNSFVERENYFDIEASLIGGLVVDSINTTFSAVYSNLSLKNLSATNKTGALIFNMNGGSLSDAYSLSNADALICVVENSPVVAQTYALNCSETFLSGNLSNSSNENYISLNWTNILNNSNFNDNDFFAYLESINSGLPYLVYNKDDINKKLLTIVAQNITANFVASEKIRNDLFFGFNKNIMVLRENEETKKAVIFVKPNENMEYNIFDLLLVATYPSEANINLIGFESSNSAVLVVDNNKGTIVITGTGNVELKIYSKANEDVFAQVYISVVEKIDEFIVNNNEKTLKLLKETSTPLNYSISQVENSGIYFNFKNLQNVLSLNNEKILTDDYEIYSMYSNNIIKAFETTSQAQKVFVAPFYRVEFNGVPFNFVDYSKLIELEIEVYTGASGIYSEVSSIELIHGESVTFDVIVSGTKIKSPLTINCEYSDLVSIESGNAESTANNLVYKVTIKNESNSIDKDQTFVVVINHPTNENVKVSIVVTIKSSKLLSVELNHYSSSAIYYDDYNHILKKETKPSLELVMNNFGVLNINLYPIFSSVNKVEVYSSVENNAKVLFNQLANKEDNLVYVMDRGLLPNGLSLYPNKSILKDNGEFEFDGNLYVSTLLSTNVAENTIFTITVVCYFGNNEKIETKIELKAKPLTSIVLSNPNGSDEYYLAKGANLELNITKYNMDEDFVVTENNFIITDMNGNDISGKDEVKGKIEAKISADKLILRTNILTQKGMEFRVTPIFRTFVNGKYVQVESGTIVVKVVDFVVNGILVEDAENGILTNNLGNYTKLKTTLNVTKCNETFNSQSDEAREKARIEVEIKNLTDSINKTNGTFNIVSTNNAGNTILNNLKPDTQYNGFSVTLDNDGYYIVYGKSVSTNNLAVKVTLTYVNGHPQILNDATNEFITYFALSVVKVSSKDHPLPISSAKEFLEMEDGQDYILLKDITLDAQFGGIDAKISSFDGNNKTINITNLVASSTSVTNLGLFNEVEEDAIIKNVTVNILPTTYYSDNEYRYGLNINAQALSELNFGVICGVNRGTIFNCKVINENYSLINNKNIYENVKITINSNSEIEVTSGILVGKNEGYITNSSVGASQTNNQISLISKGNLGGFVGLNSKIISSSYAKNITIINNTGNKLTGGFVAENSSTGKISTSFVEGAREEEESVRLTKGGLFALGNIGGFVNKNSGNIKDCYSNISISTNRRSAGFVYDNSKGKIQTSLSVSSQGDISGSFKGFTGADEENFVMSNNAIESCYYFSTEDRNGEEAEYKEPANAISSLKDASFFEGFICDGSQSSIWEFGGNAPTLVDANREIVIERKLADENQLQTDTNKYDYIYINNELGSIKNPILVSSSNEFLEALTDSGNLYKYYHNLKIQETSINYKNIVLIKDIDLSTIIDANRNVKNANTEVQKLQDIIFAGNLDGNSMTISNITITAKNDNKNYSSFGLFKQVGVESQYNSSGEIYNSKLDKDNCSVIKNLNLDVKSISATQTRSVGTLSGEIINSKLYNVSVSSKENVKVVGLNIVGGIAGRINGNSFVKGVSSSLSVEATYENKTLDYDFHHENSKKIYSNSYKALEDNLNNKVNFAGGLFGVVDIYETKISNLAQQNDGKSYYVVAQIDRKNKEDTSFSTIEFVKVGGDITISGDVVGGLFGYVSSSSIINNAKFVLNESNSQNLNGSYAVGGIAGKNSGFISYATVELEKTLQRQKDKQDQYNNSYLFSSESNKALFVGGLVGILDKGILKDSLSKVNIVAKNSQYVGLGVGLFINSKMNYVYANGYIEAQDEQTGSIVRNKGYASFIGRVSSFDYNSSIYKVVSIIRNRAINDKFNLSGLIGYNNSYEVEINGEYSRVVDNLGQEVITAVCYGNQLMENSNITVYAYTEKDIKDTNENGQTYLGGNGFEGYLSTDSWDKTEGLDVYPKLIYNKKGAVVEIDDEDSLRSMLGKGNFVLTNDIYLTKPWSPVSEFSGTFYSKLREPEQDRTLLGNYYKIYNLNINTNSKNISNNIGFFATTDGAEISNVTFVVGTEYSNVYVKDGEIKKEKLKDAAKLGELGIIVQNSDNIAQASRSLGVVSGYDKNSIFLNLGVEFENAKIETNLENVGVLVGSSSKSTFKNITIKTMANNNGALTIKKVASLKEANVGGLVGQIRSLENEIADISISNIVINATHQWQEGIYLGAIFGKASLNENISKINLKEIVLNLSLENMVENTSVGIGFGWIELSNDIGIQDVKIENSSLNVNSKSSNLKSLYAGGFAGYIDMKLNSAINNVIIGSNSSVNLSMGDSTNQNYVGSFAGQVTNGSVSNVITSNKVNLQSKGEVNYLGFIGSNGSFVKNISTSGAKLLNIISKSCLIFKDLSLGTRECFIGGLVGRNNADIENSLFLSSIFAYTPKDIYVGGLVGLNLEGSNIENSYCIEELCLQSNRTNEYGEIISYNKMREKFADFKDILKFDNEDVETISNQIEFTKGSIYNPIEVNSNDVSFEDNKYYVLTGDITLSANQRENYYVENFNSILIGNGHKITLNGCKFAKTISEVAVISSVVFEITPNEKNKVSVNSIDYVNINSIICDTNEKGALYNIVVMGNIYQDANSFAPICLTNIGYIGNVTSKVRMLATNSESTDDSFNSSEISGFVVKNKGLIVNSISTGNIEVAKTAESYKINTINNLFTNIVGFVSSNETIVYNCVSAFTMPEKQSLDKIVGNVSFVNSLNSNSIIKNCYVDIGANGSYDKNENIKGQTEYVLNNVLFDKLRSNENARKSLWTERDKGILWGESYATTSSYKEIFGKTLSTIVKIDEKDYFSVNNLSSFMFILSKLNTEYETEEETNENLIRITQIASFNSSFVTIEQSGSGVEYKVVDMGLSPIDLINELEYLGNNNLVNGLKLSNIQKIGERNEVLQDLALFYSTSAKNITIEKLALTNINYEAKVVNDDDLFIAGLVSRSEKLEEITENGTTEETSFGKVTIQYCYVGGKISVLEKDTKSNINYEFKKNYNLYAGAIVSKLGGEGSVKNCIADTNIDLDNLYVSSKENDATYKYNNENNTKKYSTMEFFGYNAYIGAIAGKVDGAEVSNNLTLNDISCNTVVSLNMGGVVGAIKGTFKNNTTYTTVFYKGGYLSYYKNSGDNSLKYNVNALSGFAGGTNENNKYNSLLSLATDTIAETDIDQMQNNDNFVVEGSKFAYQKSGENLIETESTLIRKVEFINVENSEISLENDKTYIINKTGGAEITFDYSKLTKDENNLATLKNTKILSKQPFAIKVTDSMFKTIKNCTIVNMNIICTGNISSGVVAKEIKNSRLVNINVFDSSSHSSKNAVVTEIDFGDYKNLCFGIVADYVESSVLKNVNVNSGRLNVETSEQANSNIIVNVGAIAGYAVNTIILETKNSATVTVSNGGILSSVNVAGLVGFGRNVNIFKAENNALIYSKTINGQTQMYTSGIMNANNSGEIVAFSKNNFDIKGVNGQSSNSGANYVSGICNGATALYSINSAKVISIGKNIEKNYSYGLGSQNVYFSYSFGSVISNQNCFAIGDKALVSFSLGTGFCPSYDNIQLTRNVSNSVFDLDSINASSQPYNIFTSFADFVVDNSQSLILPRIKLLESNNYALTLEADTYQISSGFELWYWGLYGDKSKDVKLLTDIDMFGYSYRFNGGKDGNFTINNNSSVSYAGAFTGKFDGNFNTIQNLTISKPSSISITRTTSIGNSITDANSWGLVGLNYGTIQNIYFESPRIRIKNDLEIVANNYVGVVCGQNAGVVENILVAETDTGTDDGFVEIDIDAQKGLSADSSSLMFGVIAGVNEKIDNLTATITGCEVINFAYYSINSEIFITKQGSIIDSPNNFYTYLGGIVGVNSSTITNNTFVGFIQSSLQNYTSWGVGVDTTVVEGATGIVGDAVSYRLYSHAIQRAGAVCGRNTGESSNNYCPYENLDDILALYTENLFAGKKFGVINGEDGVQNSFLIKTALNDVRLVAGPIVKKAVKSGVTFAFKAVGKLVKTGVSKLFVKATKATLKPLQSLVAKIGIPDLTDIADVIFVIAQTANNASSCFNSIDNSGVKTNSNGYEYGLDDYNKYIGIYAEDVSFAPYTKLATIIENDKTNKKIPFNEDFLNLSKSKVEPAKEEDTYLIYNANELAYALTENSSVNVKLMDNIDLTRKIWDSGLNAIQNVIVVDNGFKFVCTDQNKNALTKFSSIITDKAGGNSFGKFDNVSTNTLKASYENFENRLKKVWIDCKREEYFAGGEKDITDFKLEQDYTDFISKLPNEPNTYYIAYAKQLEVVADAMTTYQFGYIRHTGVTFKGKTIKILNDLDISGLNLNSIDLYKYDLLKFNDYNIYYNSSENKTYKIKLDENDNLIDSEGNQLGEEAILNLEPLQTIPEFITSSYIEDASNIFGSRNLDFKVFAGTLCSDNKTITLGENQSLTLEAGKDAIVKNITIKYTAKTYTSSASIFSSQEGSVIFGGLGVVCNEGTIENVQLLVDNDLTFNFSDQYANTITSRNNEKGNEYFKGTFRANYGLLCGVNTGTIKNVVVKTKDTANVSTKIEMLYDDLTSNLLGSFKIGENGEYGEYNIYIGDTDEKIYELDYNKNGNEIDTQRNFGGYARYLTIERNFGVISGSNSGDIISAKINNNQNFNLTLETLEVTHSNGNLKKAEEKTITANIGVISGSNDYIHNVTNTTNANYNISGIKLNNCTINVNGKYEVKVGETTEKELINLSMISGYSNLGFKDCEVISCQVTGGDNIGALAGTIAPALYETEKSVSYMGKINNEDAEFFEDVTITLAYKLEIINCTSTELPLYAQNDKFIIEKVEKGNYSKGYKNEVKSENLFTYLQYFYSTEPTDITCKFDNKQIEYIETPLPDNNKDNVTISLGDLQKENKVEIIVSDKVLDIKGKDITSICSLGTFADFKNYAIKGNVSGVEKIMTNGYLIYTSSDKSFNLDDFVVGKLANGGEFTLLDTTSQVEGDDYFVTLGGQMIPVTTNISSTKNGMKITITRTSTLKDIEFENGQLFSGLLKGLTLANGSDINSQIQEGEYLFNYEKDEVKIEDITLRFVQKN